MGEPFLDENKEYSKKINLSSSPIHKFIINKKILIIQRKKIMIKILKVIALILIIISILLII